MENQNKQEVKNNSIVSEFVPYEQALALKELGFDEPCFGFYGGLSPLGDRYYYDSTGYNRNSDTGDSDGLHCTRALYQQAFRWFREKYGLFTEFQCGDYQYYALIYKANKNKHLSEVWCSNEISLDTLELPYEEAELVCLKKLIQIVKEKQL